MLPTSTNVNVKVAAAVPADASAVAALIVAKQPLAADAANLLGSAATAAAGKLLDANAGGGKANEVSVQLVDGPGQLRRVYLAGLGDAKKLTVDAIRQSAAALARAAGKQRVERLAIVAHPIGTVAIAEVVEAITTGISLAAFDYREQKGTASKAKDSEDNAKPKTLTVTIVVAKPHLAASREISQRAAVIAQGQNFARTIASRPANVINPPSLAQVAKELASDVGLGLRVLDEKQMAKLGMGGILAVGGGSIATPPRMIVLQHLPKAAKGVKPLLVIGKAITFDSGGISIKPADKMGRMIFDKCGAMAVLGLMYALAKLKIPVPVVGILSSAENVLSSKAYRPGDIITLYNGVTVEVTNTDAEGRLVLGDALAWGIKTFKPAAVVDLATLTGGVIVALGKTIAGVMSNNDELVAQLHTASQQAGEQIWRLPLFDEHREYLKSDYADIINAGGREGSPLQGAAFLSHFVPADIPWAHLDIAGVADTEKELPYYAKGATGWGVRTLVNWVQQTGRTRA